MTGRMMTGPLRLLERDPEALETLISGILVKYFILFA